MEPTHLSRQSGEGNQSRTVLKALDVLECLAFSGQSLSAAQVARRCGLTRPTTHRLLRTLAARGYVASGEDNRYRLGTRMLSLSKRLIEFAQLPHLARSHLESLCEIAGETCHLAVLDDTEALYVDKVESITSARMYAVVGVRNPLHCTSLGKAILAFLPTQEREMLLDRISLVQRTGNTMTDRRTLERHLEQVRECGYAVDDEENEEGIRCLGAPILTNVGLPLGALSISGPAVRMTDARLEELAPALLRAGRKISQELGYVSPAENGGSTTSTIQPASTVSAGSEGGE